MTDQVELSEAQQAVKDAEANLAEARRKAEHQEFPKFVVPHESHVVTRPAIGEAPAVLSAPGFTAHHVERDGTMKVLVHNAEEEAKALAVLVKEEVKEPAAT